jgi:hypothetical protein
MAGVANPNRRGDIGRALKRTKPDTMLSLENLATIWGVQKSRFVSVKNEIPDFPAPIQQGTAHVFPARVALKAMQLYERRHDDAAKRQQARTDAILGTVRAGRLDEVDTGHNPRDLAVLSRLAAETEERERMQGLYVLKSEVARVCGDAFSEITDFCSRLSNEIDPHGRLDPQVRSKIDKRAKEALLRSHRILKDMLEANAKPADHRSPPRSSRKARA